MSTLPKKKKQKTKKEGAAQSLTSSIFNNSGKKSLSSTIFGTKTNNTTTTTNANKNNASLSLFSSPDKWEKVSKSIVSQNKEAMVKNLTTHNSSKENTKQNKRQLITKSQILSARNTRSESKDQIDLIDFITAYSPETNIDLDTVDNDEEKEEISRGIIKMFTAECDTLMRENGVLLIKSNENDQMIEKSHLNLMTKEAERIQEQICERLTQKGILFQVPSSKNDNSSTCHSNSEKESLDLEKNHSFQFYEVASRCLGRLDVRYKMNESPFNEEQVVSNKFLKPIIHSLLGQDARLVYAGLILSFKMSANQPWHQDGSALFSDTEFPVELGTLPPYALNVFIPLDDITNELGPTEFCVSSHKRENAKQAMSSLADGDEKKARVIAPLLKRGDALIYDYRVCHRGTSNLSSSSTRRMLYLMYSRPWFDDHLNFSNEKLF